MKFFNSLTKQMEVFSNNKEIKIYSCGPTVYNYAHIGNLRTFLFEDLLLRFLNYHNFKIKHVRNLTDVDDKTIKNSIEQGITLKEFTKIYTEEFFKDLELLSFNQSHTTYIKATEYIEPMITLIEELVQKGFAYEKEDGVYFKTSAWAKYGDFSGLDLKNLQEGASGVDSEFQKEDFGDFALWKKYKAEDGEIFWSSPWGNGRPGWHTECAAIVKDAFHNETIDIHTGGIDLLFPHHTNEKAHCECLSNQPMARFWLHATHLLVDNKKMSKSLGNFYTLRDLIEKGFEPKVVRFYLQTGAHYRSPLNFTLEGLKGTETSLKRINNFLQEIKEKPSHGATYPLKEKIESQLNNDLNISGALGEIFSLINAYYQNEIIFDSEDLLKQFQTLNKIFAVFEFGEESILNEITQELFNQRTQARLDKNWAESDRIRDELLKHGIEVRDSKEGTKVRRILL